MFDVADLNLLLQNFEIVVHSFKGLLGIVAKSKALPTFLVKVNNVGLNDMNLWSYANIESPVGC